MRFRFFNTFEPVVPLFRRLLPHLEGAGHQAEAWIADRDYRAGRSGPRFAVRVIPTWAPRGRCGQLRKPLVHLTYALGAAVRSLLGRGVDCNIFLTQPPLFGAWAWALKVLRGQPYCLVVMDLYPWVAVEAGVLRRGSVATRLAERLAAFTMRGADRVVVIGRCMARRVTDLGVPTDRIHMIHNWADTDSVRPGAVAERPDERFRDRFVVLYSGNLGTSHDFRDLLAVVDRFREDDGFLFVIVGEGARRREVEDDIRRRELSNVLLLPFQPEARLGETLAAGDVHFVSLRRGFEGLVVPSKAYGSLAAGRPIVYQGSREGEIARMIEEEGVGIVVDSGDADGLAAAFLRARDGDDWRRAAGERARGLAERRYGAAAALDLYEAVLTAIPPAGEGRW